MSLKKENKRLTQELDTVKSDYDQLFSDLNELKESYTEMDLSSAKSLHRCEVSQILLLGVIVGMVWYCMVLYSIVWYCMVWYGVVWYGMVWCVMVRYDIVWNGKNNVKLINNS